MTMRFSRKDLLRQLQDALDRAGADTSRWPEGARARLSAFVESDGDAARLFAEAKALDAVLSRAAGGRPRPELELRIIAAAESMPQERAVNGGGVIDLGHARRQVRLAAMPARLRRPPVWGGALLAASLILGVFIGLSGRAISTLQNIEAIAFNDSDLGLGFSGSLFAPTGGEDQGQL